MINKYIILLIILTFIGIVIFVSKYNNKYASDCNTFCTKLNMEYLDSRNNVCECKSCLPISNSTRYCRKNEYFRDGAYEVFHKG